MGGGIEWGGTENSNADTDLGWGSVSQALIMSSLSPHWFFYVFNFLEELELETGRLHSSLTKTNKERETLNQNRKTNS